MSESRRTLLDLCKIDCVALNTDMLKVWPVDGRHDDGDLDFLTWDKPRSYVSQQHEVQEQDENHGAAMDVDGDIDGET